MRCDHTSLPSRLVYECENDKKNNNKNKTHSCCINHLLVTLVKTGSESIEATLRKRRTLFAGFVARMKDTRLPKCVMFGELVGGAVSSGGQEKEWMGYLLDDFRVFGINPD